MVKLIKAYLAKCRFCKKEKFGKTESFANRWLADHEPLCSCNPALKDCASCSNCRFKTYRLWCNLHQKDALLAKIDHMDSEYHCVDWTKEKESK